MTIEVLIHPGPPPSLLLVTRGATEGFSRGGSVAHQMDFPTARELADRITKTVDDAEGRKT